MYYVMPIIIYFVVLIFGSICEKSVERGGGFWAKCGFSLSLIFIKFSPILFLLFALWILANR